MDDAETHCREILRRLHQYLDNEMPGEECAALRQHLEACAPCLEHAEFERDLKMLVRRKCSENLPEGLAERLRERLRAYVEGR